MNMEGRKMKLGINSYTFMWSIGFQGANPAFPDKAARPTHPITPIGLLDIAFKMGIKLVQTGPNLGIDRLSPEQVEEFISKAKENGIELELGTRGLDYDHLCKQVELAKRIGAKLIRTLPEMKYATDGRLIPAQSGKSCRCSSKKESGWQSKTAASARRLRAALDELDSSFVGVVLDMVNSLAIPEGWKDVTQILAPYVMCTLQRLYNQTRLAYDGFHLRRNTCGERDWSRPNGYSTNYRCPSYNYNVILEIWPT
jgi:hypothetical protein